MRYEVECQQCGQMHEADPSHMGRFGEGQIFAVYCTTLNDGLADYYTGELVREAHTSDCDSVVYRDGVHTCDCGAVR